MQGQNMSNLTWSIEHSVETTAPPAFSWMYMTDVKNWDDPPATFKLDGPFTSGSPGTTEMPGQALRHWRLRDVQPPHTYTMEIALDGAVLLCKWVFSELPDSQTRLTQYIGLEGENASLYKDEVDRAFAPTLAAGMSRIASAIGLAYAREPNHRDHS
jgi:hypothetical protein